MPTGDKQVNLFLNRLLDKTALKEQFLEFLSKKIDEGILSITAGSSGTLDADKIELSSTGNDIFDLDMSLARRLAVGDGQVITLPENANRISGEHKNIPFENTSGQTYEVGVRYASVKSGIAINARSGAPEYPSQLEEIGELGSPSSVVNDPGVKITLKVDNLTQAGINHSDRVVRVYLTTPVSGVESIAFYDDVIKWVGGENVIEIPYSGSDGPLGQDTSVYPPSTTAIDYVVHVKGASWKRGAATIYGDNDYAFIGRITGNGPAATPTGFDTSLQTAVFLFTLDKAYDGIGSGAGRTIEVDSRAVKLHVPVAGHGDPQGAAFELDALDGGANDGEIAQSILAGGTGVGARKVAGLVHFVPMTHTTVLQIDEPAGFSGGGAIMSLSRGGVNLNTANVIGGYEFVLVKGTSSFNGLYKVNSVPAANFAGLLNLDGSTPSFLGPETGTATFLRPLFFSGDHSYWSRFHNVHMHGNNEETALSVVTIYPHENAQSLVLKDNNMLSAVLFQKDGTVNLNRDTTIAAAADLKLENGAELVLLGASSKIRDSGSALMEITTALAKFFGTGDGTAQVDAQGFKYAAAANRGKGVQLDGSAHSSPVGIPDPAWDSYPMLGDMRDYASNIFRRITPYGRIVTPHTFKAEFNGHSLQVGGIGSPDMDERIETWQGSAGGGDLSINEGNSNIRPPGGVALMETGANINNFVAMVGGQSFGLKNVWGGVRDMHLFAGDICMVGRFACDSVSSVNYFVGLGGFGSTPTPNKPLINIGVDVAETTQSFIGFWFNPSTGDWHFYVLDGNTVRHNIQLTSTFITDGEWIDFFLRVPYGLTGGTCYYWISNQGSVGSQVLGTVGGPQNGGPRMEVQSLSASNKRMWVNYWELWDAKPLLLADNPS